jgi:uncharacterized phage-associated protein
MKLTKLTYIAHGWYLGLKGVSLIDENPEAWMYGPVIPRIYHEFKHWGRRPIKMEFEEHVVLSDPEDEAFLDKIWQVYGQLSAVRLSAMTHQANTPWSNTWNTIKKHPVYSLQIPEQEIKTYYKELLRKSESIQAT